MNETMTGAAVAEGPWPTKWLDNRTPRQPVFMQTWRDEDGVNYTVSVSVTDGMEEPPCVWARRVLFGQREADTAGGPAFQNAAREQQRIANEWVAALTDGTK